MSTEEPPTNSSQLLRLQRICIYKLPIDIFLDSQYQYSTKCTVIVLMISNFRNVSIKKRWVSYILFTSNTRTSLGWNHACISNNNSRLYLTVNEPFNNIILMGKRLNQNKIYRFFTYFSSMRVKFVQKKYCVKCLIFTHNQIPVFFYILATGWETIWETKVEKTKHKYLQANNSVEQSMKSRTFLLLFLIHHMLFFLL